MNLSTFCPLEKNWHILTPIEAFQTIVTWLHRFETQLRCFYSCYHHHQKSSFAWIEKRNPLLDAPSGSRVVFFRFLLELLL
jgi:hypothetical protein